MIVSYLETFSQPDLAYAVGQLNQFVANQTKQDVGCVKRVLRYLAGTMDYAFVNKRDKAVDHTKIFLHGYCDNDWTSDCRS